MNKEIKIYVACLAAYNNGKLHGAWIDATQDADSIHAEIQTMLKSSPEVDAEEWAIHDYEGFGQYKLSEFEGIETVSEVAQAIEKHGELVTSILSYNGGDIEDAIRALEENYQGSFNNLSEWAAQFLEETGALFEVPENLQYYIDFESYGQDAEINGDVYTIEKGHSVHVFWNR